MYQLKSREKMVDGPIMVFRVQRNKEKWMSMRLRASVRRIGSWEGDLTISAIDALFSDHQKCLNLILVYLSGLMISTGNLGLLSHASAED